MSQYVYTGMHIGHQDYNTNLQTAPQPTITVDFAYSEIVSRKIIAEYFKGLFERVETCIKWATKVVYWIGSAYVMVSLAAPNKLLIPIVHIPISRLKVLEVMAASRYTVFATAAGILGRGFVSLVLLPFARHAYNKYDREASNYINTHS